MQGLPPNHDFSRCQSGRGHLPIVVAVLMAIALVGCNDERQGSASRLEDLSPLIARAESTYSDEALTYLQGAFDTLSSHHVYGPGYDWQELWLAMLEHTESASTRAQTYDAIHFALRDLDDPHSGFDPPRERPARRTSSSEPRTIDLPPIKSEMLDGKLAYLEIPRFAWTGSQLTSQYASNIQDLIRRLDENDPCGWIVDLRRNTGGNMWPMIAGLGPLLGEGQIGAFIDRDGRSSAWVYRDGAAFYEDSVMAAVSEEAYVFKEELPPVAVLISSRTGSSAEAVAVAFRARPQTRFFGKPTAGAATSPRSHQLADGAWIRFSHVYFADRSDSVYRGPIDPDIEVDTTMWEDHVVARRRAAAWLRETPSCR